VAQQFHPVVAAGRVIVRVLPAEPLPMATKNEPVPFDPPTVPELNAALTAGAVPESHILPLCVGPRLGAKNPPFSDESCEAPLVTSA
jgi:hypothetical protein